MKTVELIIKFYAAACCIGVSTIIFFHEKFIWLDISNLIPSIKTIATYLLENGKIKRMLIVREAYSLIWILYFTSIIAIILSFITTAKTTSDNSRSLRVTLPMCIKSVLLCLVSLYITTVLPYYDLFDFTGNETLFLNKVSVRNIDLLRPAIFLCASLYIFGALICNSEYILDNYMQRK